MQSHQIHQPQDVFFFFPQGTDLSDGRYAHSAVLREGGRIAMEGGPCLEPPKMSICIDKTW